LITGPAEETEVALAVPLLPELPKPLQAASAAKAMPMIASRAWRQRSILLKGALGLPG
jgi:hypothetical protein